MGLSTFIEKDGEEFEIRRGNVTFLAKGIVNTGKKYIGFYPETDIQENDLLSYQIPRSAISLILNTVRDTILKWTLELEKDGILGEG